MSQRTSSVSKNKVLDSNRHPQRETLVRKLAHALHAQKLTVPQTYLIWPPSFCIKPEWLQRTSVNLPSIH